MCAADRAQPLQEIGRCSIESALSLHRLDADRANVFGEFCAEVVYVVEADEFYPGHDWFERYAIFLFVRGCDRSHGTAVEAVFESEELRADVAACGSETTSVCAGELESGLPGFCPAVT